MSLIEFAIAASAWFLCSGFSIALLEAKDGNVNSNYYPLSIICGPLLLIAVIPMYVQYLYSWEYERDKKIKEVKSYFLNRKIEKAKLDYELGEIEDSEEIFFREYEDVKTCGQWTSKKQTCEETLNEMTEKLDEIEEQQEAEIKESISVKVGTKA